MVYFFELVRNVTMLVNDRLFSKPAIYQYSERSSKGSQLNPKRERIKLITFVTKADVRKKHALNCV